MSEAVDEETLLVVAPAFPATRRTTRGGVVHVDGERLATHGGDGDVVALLGGGGLRATHLPQGGPLAARMAQAHADGFAAVVVDAETDEDLAAVVAAADELADEVAVQTLLAGSGGLTRPLAGAARPPHEEGSGSRGPTLVVVGSYSAPSRAQRSRLVEAGVTPLLLGDASRLRAALSEGPVVLSPDPSTPVVRADATAVAQQIAETVAGVVDDIDTLVLTGGETARAVLTAAGVTRLVVAGEVEPGVVHSHVPELDLHVVTKAGAFGDPDTLVRCLPSYSTPAVQEGSR
jgi:D-threonate/D-erythronate kinase